MSMTPNWCASERGTRSAATVSPGTRFDVLVHHRPRVHAVDVVGAEHQHVAGLVIVDEVEILEDGVGRT